MFPQFCEQLENAHLYIISYHKFKLSIQTNCIMIKYINKLMFISS